MKKLVAAISMAFACNAFASDIIAFPDNGTGVVTQTTGAPCFNSWPVGVETLPDGTQRTENVDFCIQSSHMTLETWTPNPDYTINVTHLISSYGNIVEQYAIANPVNPAIPALHTHYQWQAADVDGVVKTVDLYLDTYHKGLHCSGGRGGGCVNPLVELSTSYATIN
jgi:hypothetical protein